MGRNLYPGVDVVYQGNGKSLQFDFHVQPGADASVIQLAYTGAERMEVDTEGRLVLHTPGGDVIQQSPVLFQEQPGERQAVTGHYVQRGSGQIGFQVDAHDSSRELVIDPTLSFSSYLGGDDVDYASGIAADAAGNVYLTGYTRSTTFPSEEPYTTGLSGFSDVFVTKISSTGSLIYSTDLGGFYGLNPEEIEGGIAVDAGGYAYVTGTTSSTDFPITSGAYQTSLLGEIDPYWSAFVTKLSPAGNALVYSTYLGGSSEDRGQGIAVDAAGNAYVTGKTWSIDFPVVDGYQTALANGPDAFVAVLNADGSDLLWSTYLGGSGDDDGAEIVVDGEGNAYVTGSTASADFPTTAGALSTSLGGSQDAFVTYFSGSGLARLLDLPGWFVVG